MKSNEDGGFMGKAAVTLFIISLIVMISYEPVKEIVIFFRDGPSHCEFGVVIVWLVVMYMIIHAYLYKDWQ